VVALNRERPVPAKPSEAFGWRWAIADDVPETYDLIELFVSEDGSERLRIAMNIG
jgi:hypothetical protein